MTVRADVARIHGSSLIPLTVKPTGPANRAYISFKTVAGERVATGVAYTVDQGLISTDVDITALSSSSTAGKIIDAASNAANSVVIKKAAKRLEELLAPSASATATKLIKFFSNLLTVYSVSSAVVQRNINIESRGTHYANARFIAEVGGALLGSTLGSAAVFMTVGSILGAAPAIILAAAVGAYIGYRLPDISFALYEKYHHFFGSPFHPDPQADRELIGNAVDLGSPDLKHSLSMYFESQLTGANDNKAVLLSLEIAEKILNAARPLELDVATDNNLISNVAEFISDVAKSVANRTDGFYRASDRYQTYIDLVTKTGTNPYPEGFIYVGAEDGYSAAELTTFIRQYEDKLGDVRVLNELGADARILREAIEQSQEILREAGQEVEIRTGGTIGDDSSFDRELAAMEAGQASAINGYTVRLRHAAPAGGQQVRLKLLGANVAPLRLLGTDVKPLMIPVQIPGVGLRSFPDHEYLVSIPAGEKEARVFALYNGDSPDIREHLVFNVEATLLSTVTYADPQDGRRFYYATHKKTNETPMGFERTAVPDGTGLNLSQADNRASRAFYKIATDASSSSKPPSGEAGWVNLADYDRIYALGGHDHVVAATAQQWLYGGTGKDTLWAYENLDDPAPSAVGNRLFGESGHDVLHGDKRSDTLVGGEGHDTLRAYDGDDALYGGSGDDILSGGKGVDRLTGGSDNDHLYGGEGRDIIDGGTGDDVIYGDSKSWGAARWSADDRAYWVMVSRRDRRTSRNNTSLIPA